MRRAAALLLLVGACTSPSPSLPEEGAARAASCTAVRALELSQGKSGDGPVSFAGFTEILHFAMLYAAEGAVAVDLGRVMTVSQRAPTVMEELGNEQWRALIEPCNAAYPETQRAAPALPGDPYEAGMTCFGLADFMARTAFEYPEQRRTLTWLADRALAAAQPELRQRARDDREARRLADGYAARAFRAGRPASLLEQCARRFPPTG